MKRTAHPRQRVRTPCPPIRLYGTSAPLRQDRVLEPTPVPRWTHRDWRVPPGHGDTTPDGAQAARRRRVIHRILHPDQWRAHLEALPHYDPEYVYDEGHEYEDDWTTDPDYCWDGNHLHWCIFDEEGFLTPTPATTPI